MRVIILNLLLVFLVDVEGHGRLWNPPGRATAWRKSFKTPVNYNDDELYCGGLTVRWRTKSITSCDIFSRTR
jgi:hypothetical protein